MYRVNFPFFTLLFGCFLFVVPALAQIPPKEIYFGLTTPKLVINKDIKVAGGFVQDLIGTEKVNIKYNYSKTKVDTFQTEQRYLDYHLSRKSKKKGEKFLKSWQDKRDTLQERKFQKYFNRYTSKIGLIGENDSTRYSTTLLVELIEIHNKVWEELRFVKMHCSFIRPNGDVIVHFDIMGHNPKLEDCYAVSGQMLGKLILNRIKKVEAADSIELNTDTIGHE